MSGLLGGVIGGIAGSLGISLPGGPAPLTLGGLDFDAFQMEVPESLGDLGGFQSTQQHDFPGGIRTQKTFGFFPNAIKGRGKFHGPEASNRAEDLKRMLADGKEVELIYAERSWKGILAKFTLVAKHQNHYEYDLEFWPREDTSSGQPQIPFSGLGSILSLHLSALKGIISGQTSPGTLVAGITSIIGGPVFALVSGIQGAMLGAGGVMGQIDQSTLADLRAQSIANLALLSTLTSSNDPTISSPAWDIHARVMAISNILTIPPDPITTIRVVNPSLPLLAAQYYQDPQLWRAIADANGLSDPQPIGTFELLIPSNP